MHGWDLSPAAAIAIQRRLRPKLILDEAPTVKTVAGLDVSFTRFSKRLFAAVLVLDLSRPVFDQRGDKIITFPVLETAAASHEVDFPYIPGLLSFREIPVILKTWEKLKSRPDCLICDGQGLAHPRRLGLASHLGLFLDLPSIGCAKTRLIGRYEEPGPLRGNQSPLIDGEEQVGMVLRTRSKVKPVFISQGHRMTLDRAVEIILSALGRYRLPEALRLAHQAVNKARLEGTA